jgi:outer membrane protein TolC
MNPMRITMTGLFCLATLAWAEPQEVTSTLTLDEVVAEALRNNPQIRAMQSKWDAAREKPVQERTLSNPTIQYSGMDMVNGGSWPNTGEKRVSLEQEFPWFGKLGLRGKVAEKDAEIVHDDYMTMELEVVMSAKETYFDLYAVQHSLSITRAEEDVLKRMETIAETKYATGEVSQQDVLKAQTEITMLKQRLLELQQQEATLKAKLNSLMNRPTDAPLGLAVTAPVAEIDAGFNDLLARAENIRPEIKSARAEIERSQAQRELMERASLPDYRLGVEYRNVGVDFSSFRRADDMVMFTVGLDLPIWRTKYRAGVREAEKTIESSHAALEAAERQIVYNVQDAHFKLLTAKRTLELYRTALIPQAEARLSASEAGYRTGKTGFLDLLESERFLLNARLMEAMAEGNLGMLLARLERAVGTELSKTEGRK